MKRILVVDDDALYVELAREVLQSEDVNVISASNGLAALQALEKNLPDLIISDIEMPVMDGLTFYTRLKEKQTAIPFVFLSGTEDQELINRVLEMRGPKILKKMNIVTELRSLLNTM